MRFDGPGNYHWTGIIKWEFGTEVEATEKFFVCLDQFLADVKEQGLERIIADHADYERRRYGFLASSRLGNQFQQQE